MFTPSFRPLLMLVWLVAIRFSVAQTPQPGISRSTFGTLPDGRPIDLFTLRNRAGMVVTITNYGGHIVSWTAPDRQGHFDDITLGMPTGADYVKGTPAFGPIIGRYANRIANSRFVLDGQTYALAPNNKPNHIHGGPDNFTRKLWAATPVDGPEPALKLTYTSPDGEEGYPGTLAVSVTYTLQPNNALRIDYRATTDKPTVVNLTNHAYFNLTGMKRDVLTHELMLRANTFLPSDNRQIPTGAVESVAGTPFDFRQPVALGAHINDTTNVQIRYGYGYDHCWIFTDTSNALKLGATVYEPVSGRFMQLFTTEPGVQIYTANHLKGVPGKNGLVYHRRYGLCLETQHFPDSPNQPAFPSTVLRPGQAFHSTTIYQFSVK